MDSTMPPSKSVGRMWASIKGSGVFSGPVSRKRLPSPLSDLWVVLRLLGRHCRLDRRQRLLQVGEHFLEILAGPEEFEVGVLPHVLYVAVSFLGRLSQTLHRPVGVLLR